MCRRVAVGIDLADDWPAALAAAGFDAAAPSVWLIEGLLQYLDETAVQVLFERVDALFGAGFPPAVDVVGKALLESPLMAPLLQSMAENGAPWLFGTDAPGDLPNDWDGRRPFDVAVLGNQGTAGLHRRSPWTSPMRLADISWKPADSRICRLRPIMFWRWSFRGVISQPGVHGLGPIPHRWSGCGPRAPSPGRGSCWPTGIARKGRIRPFPGGVPGEVAVGEQQHVLVEAAQKLWCIVGFAHTHGAEHRVDHGASAARDHRQQPQQRIPRRAVVAGRGERGQARRGVGGNSDVPSIAQTSSPRHSRGTGAGPERVEQPPQRGDTDAATGLRQRRGGR